MIPPNELAINYAKDSHQSPDQTQPGVLLIGVDIKSEEHDIPATLLNLEGEGMGVRDLIPVL